MNPKKSDVMFFFIQVIVFNHTLKFLHITLLLNCINNLHELSKRFCIFKVQVSIILQF